MKKMYGYIRVSTVRQGDGVSLDEQRDAIVAHARAQNYRIVEWFEEKATAAKANRPAFTKMLALLKAGKADGLICHKIDRSARNLMDWAALGELIDQDIKVEFAHENLDLNARGGRLSADLQAVIAADYIRNLRQETVKGIRGRLKQGLLPNAAPVGYLNTGKGKVKAVDPVKAPLVVEAYTKYATGNYSLNELRLSLHEKGLTNPRGNILSRSAFTRMMKNQFYTGVIVLKSTGELFEGKHKPLITAELFNRVQERLGVKTFAKKSKNDFLFRARIHCKLCTKVLIGERQKGRVYYRCHRRGCPTTTVREDRLEDTIKNCLAHLRLTDDMYKKFLRGIAAKNHHIQQDIQSKIQKANLTLGDAQDRLQRINDKFVDDLIDKQTFIDLKNSAVEVIGEQKQILEQLKSQQIAPKANNDLELSKIALQSYLRADKHNKRNLLENTFSNFFVEGRRPVLQIKTALWELLNMRKVTLCATHAAVARTFCGDCLIAQRKDTKLP